MRARPLVLVFAALVLTCTVLGAQSSPVTTTANASVPPPPSATAAIAEADRSYRAGMFADAERNYQLAIQYDAKSVMGYSGLVRAQLRQQKVDEAFASATNAVKLAPQVSAAHAAMGEALFRKEDIEHAQTEFLAAYNLNNRDARALFGLYRVFRSASYYRRAMDVLQEAHAIDPRDPEIHRVWINTLRPPQRIAELEKYLGASAGLNAGEREVLERRLALLKTSENEKGPICRATSKVEQTQVPLEMAMPRPNILRGNQIRIEVNGHKLRPLLDTGASGIVITRKAAEKAALVPLLEVKYGGIGDEGERSGYVARAQTITVGELAFENCIVLVTGAKSLTDEDGLIGADVFSNYLVSIDFPGQALKLGPLPKRAGESGKPASLASSGGDEDPSEPAADAAGGPQDRYVAPEMRTFTPIFRFGHALLIPTRVDNSGPKLFLIDSGAMDSSISPSAARETTSLQSDIRNTRVRGLSGEIKKLYRAEHALLQFGNIRQENTGLLAFDTLNLSSFTGAEVSGILGYTVLGLLEVQIDYRDGLVNFLYDPKKARPIPQYH